MAPICASLAEQHGVAERFIPAGEVPFQQMADYYAAADVVAIPSLMEGGNKTLSEGTLFGTPFVATETAGTIGFFRSRRMASACRCATRSG